MLPRRYQVVCADISRGSFIMHDSTYKCETSLRLRRKPGQSLGDFRAEADAIATRLWEDRSQLRHVSESTGPDPQAYMRVPAEQEVAAQPVRYSTPNEVLYKKMEAALIAESVRFKVRTPCAN